MKLALKKKTIKTLKSQFIILGKEKTLLANAGRGGLDGTPDMNPTEASACKQITPGSQIC